MDSCFRGNDEGREVMGTLEFSFERKIGAEQLAHLMAQTGWGRERTVEGLAKMLDETTHTLGAWDGDKLVGFLRAISDGKYRCLMEDFIVDEPYRSRGVGARLMQTMLDKLSDIEHVYLFTGGEKMKKYYEGFGFEITPYLSMRMLPGEQG